MNFNHVGFSFSQSKLQLVEVVKKTSKYCLENVDEHIFESGINPNSGSDAIIDILQNSFTHLSKKNSFKSRNISFALSPEFFNVFKIPVESSLSTEELNEHIGWEFSILFPNKNFAEQIVRTIPLKSYDNTTKLLVITTSLKLIKTLFSFSKQNNLQLRFVDLANFASDVFVDSENKKTLSLFFDDTRLTASSYFNNKLSDFKSFELKTESLLAEIITNFIDENNTAFDTLTLASIHNTEEISRELEEKLNIEVIVNNPFDNLELSDDFIPNGFYINLPNLFSAAAGISFRKF